MIYHLFEYLQKYDIPGQHLFGYLSFRAILACITALLIAIVAGKHIIRWIQRKQIGEEIRDLGLEGQLQKKGTPTMGGIIIYISIIIPVLLFADLTNIYTIIMLLSSTAFFAIGLADDYIKVFKHNKDGMSPKTKLLAQGVVGLAIALTVWLSPDIVVREKVAVNEPVTSISSDSLNVNSNLVIDATEDVVKSTKTTIPFVKSHEFDYKYLSPFKGAMGWYCKWAIYLLMIVIVISACSNGVNLTDGMDGLASGTSAIAGVVLGIFAWLGGNVINSDYLNIMYIPGSGEIAVFMAAFVGALIGFLWYNSYPAQVFMGDTGSLMLGGIIGVSAILIRKELLLLILCGIFMAESLSVLIQTSYFKFTRKKYGTGRRFFRMAPLHHHYQKEGDYAVLKSPKRAVPEAKIVLRFWIIALILAVVTIALLKIR